MDVARMERDYISRAGYIGGLTTLFNASVLIVLKETGMISAIEISYLVFSVLITLVIMFAYEFHAVKKFQKKENILLPAVSLDASNRYIVKSALFRFFVLLVPLLTAYILIVFQSRYLDDSSVKEVLTVYHYVIAFYLLLAPFYLFLTLKYRGDKRYEFNDYAIVTMIAIRSFYQRLRGEKGNSLYRNRRIKKVFLVFVVNYFFLSLMAAFLVNEFRQLELLTHNVMQEDFARRYWYIQVRNWYLVIFHTFFLVDVTIAVIGYVFASRWLDNRTRSVDMTLWGWIVALACYPPFNTFIYTHLLPYGEMSTSGILLSETVMTISMAFLIVLYGIYVWGTLALGFKFSNLTNRGIISHGPYRYVRHPAYASKNIAWMIENVKVFTNIWATLAFLGWTALYIMRAVTEERHLLKDKRYAAYRKKVKYMFVPKLI